MSDEQLKEDDRIEAIASFLYLINCLDDRHKKDRRILAHVDFVRGFLNNA